MAREQRRQRGGRGSGRLDTRSPTQSTGWRRWRGAVLLAWVAVIYLPALSNGFTYDDPTVIADASRLLGDSSLLGRIFTADYFRLSGESTYRPIVTLTYVLDWRLGGGAPWAFHLQSILWHVAAVGLLLVLLRRMGVSDTVRYTSALLYGVHPALTEAVDAVAFREDVLATAFGLLGLVLFTADRPRRLSLRLLAGSLAFGAALFSKESAVVFVVLLPLTMWAIAELRERGSWSASLLRREYAALALTTVVYLIVRFVLLPSHESYGSRFGESMLAVVATGTVAIGYYLRLLWYPVALCADYRGVVSVVTSAADWRPWLSLTSLAGLSYVVWRWRRRRPELLWGWLWFLVALGPVSNVIPIPTFMAERFLYLPFVGLVVCAVTLMTTLAAAWKINPRVATGLVALVAVLLSAATWSRHRVWRSDDVLWATTLRDHPNAHGALHGYGSALIQQGRYADGIVYLQRLLADPTIAADRRAAASSELGSVYDRLGETEAARRSFEQAIAAGPAPRARLGLALIYFRLERLDDAKAQLDELLRSQPDDARAYSVLGGVLSRQGHPDEALQAWREAIRLDPGIASAHANIGVTLGRMKRLDEGIAALETALAIEPRQAQWHTALARLLMARQETTLAREHLEEALRIDPGFNPAREALQALPAP